MRTSIRTPTRTKKTTPKTEKTARKTGERSTPFRHPPHPRHQKTTNLPKMKTKTRIKTKTNRHTADSHHRSRTQLAKSAPFMERSSFLVEVCSASESNFLDDSQGGGALAPPFGAPKMGFSL